MLDKTYSQGPLFFLAAMVLGGCLETTATVGEGGTSSEAGSEAGTISQGGTDASTPTPDATRPDAATSDGGVNEAGDASATVDSGDAGPMVDGGPLDAAPPPPVLSTVANIPGLADFDFTDTRLAFRVGAVTSTCTLAACADGAPVANMLRQQGQSFSIAGDLIYFSGRPVGGAIENIFSVKYDGTALTNRTNYTTPFGAIDSFVGISSFAGGSGKVEGMFRWSRSGDAGWKYILQAANGASANANRIGRATANLHANDGSEAKFFPEQVNFVAAENNPGRLVTPRRMTTTGATLPAPLTDPTAIAVSARGAGVTYPAVAIAQGGTIKACPTATDCAAWLDLGALGTSINMDAENLYVGSATGLGKCSLTEIATLGTCTLVALVTAEAISDPMYVTPTHVYFRNGDRVRRVTK